MTTMDEYQKTAESTAIYPRDKGLEYTALGLVGEAGEYANKVKKIVRDAGEGGNAWEMADELGDVLWYVAMAARELNISLEQVASRNMTKLADRQMRGKLGGSGDKR